MVLVSSRFQGHKFTGSRLSIHPFKHSAPSKYRIKDDIKGSYQKGNQGDNEGSPRAVGQGGGQALSGGYYQHLVARIYDHPWENQPVLLVEFLLA